MCTVCGCAGDGAKVEGQAYGHGHHHPHGHDHHHHDHAHSPGHDHGHGPSHKDHVQGDLHYGQGPAHAHAPGLTQARMVEIETSILSKNDAYADTNRARLAALETLALNLVSSPGSGKTTLLCRTVSALMARHPVAVPVAVIEGDQQTANDADRIRATGAPAIQVNTGKGCHLDAHMVGHAIDHLSPTPGGVLFIENVGNLVCPAAFDLGEAVKVAILSVTEGEDKPLKYPDMFAAAGLVILNKIDLAPHCDIDLELYETNARRVNPGVEVIRLSARTGEGMAAWLDWIENRRAALIPTAAAQ
ncbi:hydrogenase nickel incorporation protein HypB [Rhodospirillum sp. A1_3_36]|uniref:hydrogenase nickel incorporation protein HypB n=1 Tax=Rhodospirillum sp. A1_3_36 TaxID=3391666 RepID=UPI0039A5CFC1